MVTWIARYYLFGVIPVGEEEIGPGVISAGEAWLCARMCLALWFRPWIGIIIKEDTSTKNSKIMS